MGAWWDRLGFGQRVDRAEAVLPQTTTLNIFNIVGGRVLMTSIIGEVGTVAIAAVANNTKLTATPDSGSNRDICTVTDNQSFGIGELLGITGIAANAMIPPTPGYGSVEGMTVPVVLKAGALTLDCGGNTVTGKVKWTMHYIPIDDGAYVEAVAIP